MHVDRIETVSIQDMDASNSFTQHADHLYREVIYVYSPCLQSIHQKEMIYVYSPWLHSIHQKGKKRNGIE